MDKKKLTLLECAAMLMKLGEEVERAWRYVVWLRERGAEAETFMMRTALQDFREAEESFRATEKQYLALRDEFLEQQNGEK